MIIIRIAVEILILAYLIYLSVHDIRTKTVTDKSLLLLLPLAALRITLDIFFGSWKHLLFLILGGVFGFCLMLMTAIITHNGIGGGDIKLTGILGCLCGLDGILILLLAASFSAAVYGIVSDRLSQEKKVRIPFVPFMTAGYLLSTAASILFETVPGGLLPGIT